jgi:hypothetical protein
MVAKVKTGKCNEKKITKKAVAKQKFYYRTIHSNKSDDLTEWLFEDHEPEDILGFEEEYSGSKKWTEERIAEAVRHVACNRYGKNSWVSDPVKQLLDDWDEAWTGNFSLEVSLTPFKD